MKSCFFREWQRYTKREIAAGMDISPECTVDLLRKLKSFGVVKAVKSSASINFENNDVIIADVDISANDEKFVFDYVGIVTVGDYIFKIYPKYLGEGHNLTDCLAQAIRVIKKYNAKKQAISLANSLDEHSLFNVLAVMVFIIDDFVENGPYRNIKERREINGDGEIDWEKTINEIAPHVIKNKPYYLELCTISQCTDNSDYFTRLHTCITAECLNILKVEGLTELLSIESEVTYDGDLQDFGSTDYILYRLAREMNAQFSSRKTMLLKTMYAYISEKQSIEDNTIIGMYGTNSMNLVWEDVCSSVLGNVLQTKLKTLPFNLSQKYQECKNFSLKDLIPAPLWTAYLPDKQNKSHFAKDTLIPDTICFLRNRDSLYFAIFDAKYYCIRLDKTTVSGQPGVEDVTKQYLYQLAYNDFILSHHFNVMNAFLLPGETMEIEVVGKVGMDFLSSIQTNPALKDILVIKLPASKMYTWYLSNQVIDFCNEFPVFCLQQL